MTEREHLCSTIESDIGIDRIHGLHGQPAAETRKGGVIRSGLDEAETQKGFKRQAMLRVSNAFGIKLLAQQLRSGAKHCLPYAPKPIREMPNRWRIQKRERLVDEKDLTTRYREALALLRLTGTEMGDYLEFGVYHGTSLACMYHVQKKLNLNRVRLFGFDSFEGLPPIAATDCGGHWQPGAFKTSLEFTMSVLKHEGVDLSRVVLTKGFFEEMLTVETKEKLGIRKGGVIMVDCDLYQSTKEVLAFCEPLIVDQSVLFFDDWFPLAERNMGEKLAFDEFIAAAPHFVVKEFCEFKPWGKAFVVSRKPKA